MKGPKILLLALLIAVGLIAVVVLGLRGWLDRFIAQHWQDRLNSVTDDRAPLLLGQAAALGDAGIPVLVEALGSRRESVARAGKRALLEELDRWEMLSPADASPKLALLAKALADHVDDFGLTARADAAQLATRILLWPLDRQAVDRQQVIGWCETVLRTTALDRRLLAEKSLAGRPERAVSGENRPATDQARSGLGERPSVADREQPGIAIAKMAQLPGGGLPIHKFPTGSATGDSPAAPRMADVRAGQPRHFSGESNARPLNSLRKPERLPINPHDAPKLLSPLNNSSRSPDPGLMRSFTGSPTPGDRDDRLQDGGSHAAARTSTIELMQRLQAVDKQQVDHARDELERRGFSEFHFDLARRLFAPDPHVRIQLARSLPTLQNVNAEPWLLCLCEDENADVRLAALTLLATTGDPILLERVERIARADPDPRIQRRAEQIAARRGQPRR